MKLYSVTGGIGMGKSTCRDFLKSRDLPVVDTDDIARELVELGTESLAEIQKTFGDRIILPNGKLDRTALAKKVFSSPFELKMLEAILHPRIRRHWQNQVTGWEQMGERIGFVIIPLLFEISAEDEFDEVICVACSEKTQRKRLRARNWGENQIDQRLASQWRIEKKISLSDYLIWTDVPVEFHAQQLNKILR